MYTGKAVETVLLSEILYFILFTVHLFTTWHTAEIAIAVAAVLCPQLLPG